MKEPEPKSPKDILTELQAKSNMIVRQRKRRDAGGFRSVADAVTFQRLLREREKLRGELPPLRLVTY